VIKKAEKNVVTRGKAALDKPMTLKEQTFLKAYKENFEATGMDGKAIAHAALVMGIAYKTAEQYRYHRIRIRTDLDKWKRVLRSDDPDEIGVSENISIRWITDKLKFLFETMEHGGGKVNDMVSVLNSMVNILSKFNNQFAGELEAVRNMPTTTLLEKFATVAAKVFGNRRAGIILSRIISKPMGGLSEDKLAGRVKKALGSVAELGGVSGGEVDRVEPENNEEERVEEGSEEDETPDEKPLVKTRSGSVGDPEPQAGGDAGETEVVPEERAGETNPQL
jgi:hypothetical protein